MNAPGLGMHTISAFPPPVLGGSGAPGQADVSFPTSALTIQKLRMAVSFETMVTEMSRLRAVASNAHASNT